MAKKTTKKVNNNELDGPEFFAAIAQIEQEKGIKPGYMMEKITQALISAYGEDGAPSVLHDLYANAGDHVESSGSAPLKLCEAGEVAVGFGLRHQAVAAKAEGLPIDFVDPTEGNFSLTESVAVLDKGDKTNPLAMKMAQCIIENGRSELQPNYPNPLYEGETADPANQSDYPSIFDEPLTFELFTAHQELSERAKG